MSDAIREATTMSEHKCPIHGVAMEWLPGRNAHPSNLYCPICDELTAAKARIAELEEKAQFGEQASVYITELEKALGPFALEAEFLEGLSDEEPLFGAYTDDNTLMVSVLKLSHLRRAAALLNKEKN